MLYMFYMCENVKELDVSNWNTSNVTNMIGTFYGCKKIISLDYRKYKIIAQMKHYFTSK